MITVLYVAQAKIYMVVQEHIVSSWVIAPSYLWLITWSIVTWNKFVIIPNQYFHWSRWCWVYMRKPFLLYLVQNILVFDYYSKYRYIGKIFSLFKVFVSSKGVIKFLRYCFRLEGPLRLQLILLSWIPSLVTCAAWMMG